jgi:hypothetical protein
MKEKKSHAGNRTQTISDLTFFFFKFLGHPQKLMQNGNSEEVKQHTNKEK